MLWKLVKIIIKVFKVIIGFTLTVNSLKMYPKNKIIEIRENVKHLTVFFHINNFIDAIILSFKKVENTGLIKIFQNDIPSINVLSYLIIRKVTEDIAIVMI